MMVVVTSMTFAGCGKKYDFVIAIAIGYPPTTYIENGQLFGIDIDILTTVTNEMGKKKTNYNISDSLGQVVAVQNGKADISQAMSITDERKQQIDFTVPLYNAEPYFLVRQGDTSLDGKNAEQILDYLSGKKIGVVFGSTPHLFMNINPAFANSTILSYDDRDTTILALKNGQVDYVIMTFEISFGKKMLGITSLIENMNVKLVDTPIYSRQSAFGVRKGNTELLEKVNEILENLIDEGKIEEIFQKYIDLGF